MCETLVNSKYLSARKYASVRAKGCICVRRWPSVFECAKRGRDREKERVRVRERESAREREKERKTERAYQSKMRT